MAGNKAVAYIGPVNATVISLDEAPEGYQAFDKGASRKYVLDPHGMLGDKHRIAA
jgi:hypothetical protein